MTGGPGCSSELAVLYGGSLTSFSCLSIIVMLTSSVSMTIQLHGHLSAEQGPYMFAPNHTATPEGPGLDTWLMEREFGCVWRAPV